MSGSATGRPPLGRSLAFPVSEYRRRLAKAEAGVEAARLDALLTTITANICWLTGFQSIASYSFALFATLVRPGHEPVLLSSDFESHNALIDAWIDDVRTYGVMDDPIEAVAGLLRSAGLERARIGIETGHGAMTIGQLERLRELVPGATFVDGAGIVERARAVKSALELDALREAGRIASAGMAAALAAVAPGATDNDVAAAAADAVIRAGGEHFAIVPIVTAGRRSGIPHTSFRRNRLAAGEPVFIEVCGTYLRYSAPMLRTASLGEPAPDVRRAFEACRASVETLLREVRAGIPASTVARAAGAAMRAIEPNLIWHGYYGGSTGLSFTPTYSDGGATEITERNDDLLEAGMTFHASTSLRRLGEFGVTVSETIAVTDEGCEVLTSGPRELHVAGR